MRKTAFFQHICLLSILIAECALATETQLMHTGASTKDRFGHTVSVSNNAILVGAPYDDDSGSNAGAVYFYQYDGTSWTQQQKIIHSAVTADDEFGSSISIENDQAIIGAPADNTHGDYSGAAYFYRFDGSTWNEDAVVSDPAGASFDQFGSSIAISGDYAFVGVPNDDDQGSNAGSVFVYYNGGSGWAFHQKLEPGAGSTSFGRSVSMDGSLAAIGADGDDQMGLNAGAVYVFRLDGTTWTLDQTVTAGDPGIEDYFGTAVALDSPQLLIGAPKDNDLGSDSGSVYVFTRDSGTFTQKEKLNAGDGTASALFGDALALSGRFAIVGSHSRDGTVHPDEGGAYLLYYNERTWVELSKLLPQNSGDYDYYGFAVAISDDFAVVGAPKNTDLANLQGNAYVYDNFLEFLPLPATGPIGMMLMILFFSLLFLRHLKS
ncbi:FG-GAP repeat protein [bacterium]|nr:FG-GAP repeat protein [candidate division CSSED10-310 bacterium]